MSTNPNPNQGGDKPGQGGQGGGQKPQPGQGGDKPGQGQTPRE